MSTIDELVEIVERVRVATQSLSGDEFRLREIAFEKLLEHELSTTHNGNGPPSVMAASKQNDVSVDTSLSSPQMRADEVAQYFGIDPESTGDLFDLKEEVPALNLPANRLTQTKAQGVREISLLVCGVRTALGLDTGSQDIKLVAEHYNRLDANFMKHLTGFDKVAVRGKPGSPNRLVRMRATGAEECRTLAQRLVSDDLG